MAADWDDSWTGGAWGCGGLHQPAAVQPSPALLHDTTGTGQNEAGDAAAGVSPLRCVSPQAGAAYPHTRAGSADLPAACARPCRLRGAPRQPGGGWAAGAAGGAHQRARLPHPHGGAPAGAPPARVRRPAGLAKQCKPAPHACCMLRHHKSAPPRQQRCWLQASPVPRLAPHPTPGAGRPRVSRPRVLPGAPASRGQQPRPLC